MFSLHDRRISDASRILDRLATFHGKYAEYRRLDLFTDVTIVCQEGCKFRCHRMALAAASDYFAAMFSANFREGQNSQDVYLQNIDCSTFESILEYAYSGKVVPIDDDNVYSLLFASDFLIIPDIEIYCTHYLVEKNIPMDHALSIYLLASRLEKKTIESVTGKFILDHLVHFCRDREFLRVHLRDLGPILKHFETSTEIREKALLNVIFRWVTNLEDTDGNNIGSRFTELTQLVRFEFISQSDIQGYFNRVQDAGRSNVRDDAGVSIDSDDSNFIAEKKDLSLYAFFYSDVNPELKTNVYSLRGTDENAEWYVSSRSSDAINELRVVKMNGLLYSLKWSGSRWTFSSSTEMDLRTNLMSLTLPLPLHNAPSIYSTGERTSVGEASYSQLSMCTFRNRVYLFGLDEGNIPFQYYNAELDTWSLIPNVMSDELKPIGMASDNNRIYMIMHQKNCYGGSLVFRAYDPRVGRLEALNFPEIISVGSDGRVGCCCHRNKFYVSSIQDDGDTDDRRILYLSSYDSLADKWNVLNMGARQLWQDIPVHWLVSDNRKLWMFGFSAHMKGYYYVLSYDSFVQEWDTKGCSARNIIRDSPAIFIHAVAI